jgi:hypothetical protein
MQAYGEVGEHAKKEFRGLLDMKTDLRQTAMAQMLRLNTKKMFKMGYANLLLFSMVKRSRGIILHGRKIERVTLTPLCHLFTENLPMLRNQITVSDWMQCVPIYWEEGMGDDFILIFLASTKKMIWA